MPTNALSAKSLSALVTTAGGSITDLADADNIEAFAAACCGLKYTKGSEAGAGTFTLNADKDNGAKEMLAYLDDAINNVSNRVTKIGAVQNRVSSAITALDVQSQNLTSSLSTLRDTDIAQESSNYIQNQILQQASATLLSTANQLPSVALNLI